MKCHQIGGARVLLAELPENVQLDKYGKGIYSGEIRVGKSAWRFRDLHAWSTEQAVRSAVSFAVYYTSDNRGDDLPSWAPKAAMADKIQAATAHAQDDQGSYRIRACRAARRK